MAAPCLVLVTCALEEFRWRDNVGITPQPEFAPGLRGENFLPGDLGIGHAVGSGPPDDDELYSWVGEFHPLDEGRDFGPVRLMHAEEKLARFIQLGDERFKPARLDDQSISVQKGQRFEDGQELFLARLGFKLGRAGGGHDQAPGKNRPQKTGA